MNQLQEKIKAVSQNKFSYPVLLFIISFISYGLFLPWMKFFHDEYTLLWFYEHAQDLTTFFTDNRPFLANFYHIFFYIFRDNSFLWAIFSILSRWIFALCFYRLIVKIWPINRSLGILVGFFCIVYPVFQAQFASILIGILFVIFSMFLFSLLLTIRSLENKKNKALFTLLALILSFLNLITIEYFFMLEILRFLIIYIILLREKILSQRKMLQESSTYLILFTFMIIRRFFIQSVETTYSFRFDNLSSSLTSSTIFNFVKKILVDGWNASLGAWINLLFSNHLFETQSTLVLTIVFILILVVALVVYLFLKNQDLGLKHSEINRYSILLLSIAALICGGVPFWIANLPIGEPYMLSRWTVPFMVGASILIAWLLLQLRNTIIISLLVSVLIAIGTGNQMLAGNTFRQDWDKVRDYTAQFTWRIPSLQENTTILSNYLDFKYENSDQISMALNHHYPSREKMKISLFQIYLPERINTNLLPSIEPNMKINGRRCYSSFQGNTSQAIVVEFQDPACFKVLDPELDIYNPNIDDLSKEALILSNLDLIGSNKDQVGWEKLENIFSKEPTKDWCYYYEKADLARQYQNWEEINQISDKVIARGFLPRDDREWLPFIEGYAHVGKWEFAVKLTERIHDQTPEYNRMLQALWERISEETKSSPERKQAEQIVDRLVD